MECLKSAPGVLISKTFKNIIGIEKALYVAKACQIQNIPPEKCESKLVSLFFLILKKLIFFFFFWKKGLV
jgi:hypothetical protein